MGHLIRMVLVALGMVLPAAASAQTAGWPSQPIKLVVPYAPGSSGDISARKIAPLIGQRLGTRVIIENRTGATGNVGIESVANAPADGHTFVIASDIQSAVLPLIPNATRLDYDKVFVPVAPLVFVDMLVAATPTLEANTLAELVALAKANPGKLNYGSTGIGSSHQLIMEHLKMLGGFDVFHIPYRSSPAALPDLASGRIQVMFTALSTAMGLLSENKVKVLAVGALERNPKLPNVPTLSESGFPGLEFYSYWSVWARSGTPEPILARMREAVLEATANPDVRAWFTTVGLTYFSGGMESLTSRTKSDREKWAKVITANKIEVPK